MNEEGYSTKEWIAELSKDMNLRFDKVDEAQAHTNGDVTNLKMWRGYITGGLTVISALVIPLVIYVWNTSQKVQSRLETLSSMHQTYEK